MNITDIYPIYSRIWKASNFETKEKLVEVNWTFRDMETKDHIWAGYARLGPLLKAMAQPTHGVFYFTEHERFIITKLNIGQWYSYEVVSAVIDTEGRTTVWMYLKGGLTGTVINYMDSWDSL